MAYNGGGGAEDSQNWPFSVRYTASPYRKSKFPASDPSCPLVQTPGGTSHTTGFYHGQYPPPPPHFQHLSQFQLEQQEQLWNANINPAGVSPSYYNSARAYNYHYHNSSTIPDGSFDPSGHVNLGNYNHNLIYHPSYQQYCFLQQQHKFQHPHSGVNNSEGQYGLPLTNNYPVPQQHYSNEQQYFTRNQRSRTRTRYAPSHIQQFAKQQMPQPQQQQVNNGGTLVDEGYIEDLKQPSSVSSSNCQLGTNGSANLPPISHHQSISTNANNNTNPNKNTTECDPYSYVYDSKLVGESQPVGISSRFGPCGNSAFPSHTTGTGPSILERLQRETPVDGRVPPWQVSGSQPQEPSGFGIDRTVSSGQYPYNNASENEYEEISDVARYMSHTSSVLGSSPENCNGSFRGHFKSFSTPDHILAEVVEVQQGHDRVLDQLNLDVENLLLDSTAEMENHSYSNISPPVPIKNGTPVQCHGVGDMPSVSTRRRPLVGISESNRFGSCHQQSLSMDSGVKAVNGHCYSNGFVGSLRHRHLESSASLACDCHLGGQNPVVSNQSGHRKSKSETCACCCTSGVSGNSEHTHSVPVNANGTISGTFGRRKKLDRSLTTPCCQNQPSVQMSTTGGGHSFKRSTEAPFYDHEFIKTPEVEDEPGSQITDFKTPKPRHHRSHSIIPHWKIKEHLMKLPFLKHRRDKLKKTESCSLSGESENSGTFIGPNSISASAGIGNNQPDPSGYKGFLIPTSISSYSLKKKKKGLFKGGVVPSGNNSNMAVVKARSSSMDELRVTGQEEHWYSADSDTEPDSFTALPSELSSQVGNALMTMTSSGLLTLGLNNGTPSVPPNSTSATENGGSRLDVSSPIAPDHIPKAPKFRRGSGIKDKWRESWTQSKTLSKTNMEEENRLLRWFSLRKNHHGGSTTTVDGGSGNNSGSNRNSTLPLLSEEDLKRLSFMEDEEGYWPRRTVLPPTLPVPPTELTPEQITRRHIVAAIVHSENNYVSALQRLVNEYKKPLECSHPLMLSHSKIATVFHRVPEILQCHSLFRIALAEYIRKWDTDEKIGDVFVASFSKSLVLDVYSEFINNFGQGMETAKAEARRKSAFAEFLKVKQMTAHDRLSLFGLMVKPVQRFPQFILLLQDLLKHTPKDHHDRMSLQLALTQLESLAAMLNERKRESEQYQAFRETIKSIGGGKFVLLRSITDDPNRILLRQDLVTQLEFDSSGGAVAKSKNRKLLLLNDMLICVTMSSTGTSTSSTERAGRRNSYIKTDTNPPSSQASAMGINGKVEKSVFKWSFPVREVEVEDISISPTMSRYVSSGRGKGSGGGSGGGSGADGSHVLQDEESQSLSLLEEMQSLMHDYSVLSRISELITTLKSSYEGLTESFIKELLLEIQHQIRCRDEQISYFDSSCLTLLLGTGNNREKVVFQLQSPTARNEWIEELRLAQLALDPNNSPGWDVPPESPYPQHRLPLFVRSLSLCRSPHLNTVKAGCFFTHTSVSPTGRSKILDYLWVSCTDGFSSHITSYRSQQNVLKEITSFDLVEEKINDLIFVSGHVWMATESRKVMVFDPSDTEKGHVSQCLLSESVLKLSFFGNTIYAGLADGTLAIFTQIENPKELNPSKLLKLGSDKIISVFGAREHIYASCGNSVVTIDAKTYTIERSVVLTHHNGPISHMTCSGVGLWITTQESGTVCLYHLESLQHLQDVNIAPSVFRTVRDSYRRQKGCYVTCLIAHKGWLWIGTNLGVVLTIPLPRLEGVPIISTGKANVSYHGYYGPITFLMPLTKAPLPTPPPTNNSNVPNPSSTSSRSQKLMAATPVKLKTGNVSSHEGDSLHPDDEKFRTPPRTTFGNVSFDEKDLPLPKSKSESASPSLSNSSSFNESSKPGSHTSSPLQSFASGLGNVRNSGNDLVPSLAGLNRTLVVLRKKNSRGESSGMSRNCKTLPRGGPVPLSLRFSIDSDVYGLYGNLINVRGLEDEGRFVDPLYDALRRSDPELVALDAKISTLDRRIKMRMSRPRSLDLSNWSVDSKISASSDESVGLGGLCSRSSQATDSSNIPTPVGHSVDTGDGSTTTVTPPPISTSTPSTNQPPPTPGTTKKTINRATVKNRSKVNSERTVIVVVGGRGYVNMRSQNYQDVFINGSEAEGKQCTNLMVWQMKT